MTAANRIPVLMYHRVGDSRNSWEARYAIPPERFAKHMQALHKNGYHPVDIDDFFGWCQGSNELPEGAFLLTFDDGFQGVAEYASPILEKLSWPYVVFLVSGRIGEKDDWTVDSNPDHRSFQLLNADEIKRMRDHGCSFHSHTCTHRRLPLLGDEELAVELSRSREELSILLGKEVNYLAYPYGLVDERVEMACRAAGYQGAFSTRSGFNRQGVDLFQIRRIEVYGTDSPAMLMRKIRLGCNDGSIKHMAGYYWSRLVNSVG